MDLTRLPRRGVLPKRDASGARIDVEPADQVAAYTIQEPLGIGLPSEVLGSLRTTRMLAPSGPIPAVRPSLDARHG